MSLYNFSVIAIITVFASVSSLYSSASTTDSSPTTQVEEEVSMSVVEVEVNPIETEEVTSSKSTAPYTGKTWHGRPGIIYTQDEHRLLPVMEEICRCESGKQFREDGTVVPGVVNPLDRGMCQINRKYHGETSQSLGFDIEAEEGNIQYANWLYTQKGAQPWYLSRGCHGIG